MNVGVFLEVAIPLGHFFLRGLLTLGHFPLPQVGINQAQDPANQVERTRHQDLDLKMVKKNNVRNRRNLLEGTMPFPRVQLSRLFETLPRLCWPEVKKVKISR